MATQLQKLQDVLNRAKNPTTKSERFLGSLEALAETIDTRASMEELVDAISLVVKFAGETRQLSAKEIKSIQPEIRKILSEGEKDRKKFKKEVLDLISQVKKEFNDTIKNESKLIVPVKGVDYFDGKDSDPSVVKDMVLSELPEQVFLDGDETIEVINDAKEEKIKKERIEGLDLIEKMARTKAGKGSGGITGRDIIQSYDLSPELDGVTKTFNIPGNWRVISVDGSSFPYKFRKFVDYTYTPQTITFTDEITASSSLAAGQTVEIIYVIG